MRILFTEGGQTKCMTKRKNASYKVVADAGGNRYRFYCDLSGALLCTTKPYHAASPEQELELAWENEGKSEFNHCKKCGKWVSDVMYNADVLECVECAPWEDPPNFCPQCGKKLSTPERYCPKCGAKLLYEGGEDNDK